MKKEEVNLDQIKGNNPFKVPDGYMEGLADRIMKELPEKTVEPSGKVLFMDRIRPWLYMAAVFAGLGLFFKAIIGVDSKDLKNTDDSLLVRTELQNDISTDFEQTEDEEYLEYLETQYVDYLLNEELLYTE